MTTYYYPHEISLIMKYVCENCGHKMKRVNKDYYTNNPFNRHTDEACKADTNYNVFTKKRKCPKCGKTVVPFLTEEQKEQVQKWKKIWDEDCDRINKEVVR